MTNASKTWQAPGPGLWEMDEAHQSVPYSNYMIELFETYFNAGMEEGGLRYGVLIERFDMRSLDGWQFMRPRIVGAPEKPGPLPPRWLFSLLFRVHPALRRRTKAAAAAVAELRWRQDAEWWLEEGRAAMSARLGALQAIEPASLSDAELGDHLAGVSSAFAEGFRIHFRNALAHWLGVGDWLASATEWTGLAADKALLALEGSSPYSIDALAYLDKIATAAKDSPDALTALTGEGEARQRLASLGSASPAVASALDEYLNQHGWRIYTGFDIADKATVELPQNILDSVAARLNPADAKSSEDSFATELRTKVPKEHLEEYDSLFETAGILYGVRDDDAGPCVHWTLGLMRRVLLEVGTRLVQRGQLKIQEHIFEATPAEVETFLADSAAAGSGDELQRRAEARSISAANRPPSRLGEDEGPQPPDDWLPPAVARVNRALMQAMAVEYPPAAQEAANQDEAVSVLTGLTASKGSYEGRACVIQSPDDFAKLQAGDILVAPFTTTSYNVVLPLIGGVVTEKGGVLSHAAIVAREFALPAVVNVADATTLIADGSRVRIDGEAGTVEILSRTTA